MFGDRSVSDEQIAAVEKQGEFINSNIKEFSNFIKTAKPMKNSCSSKEEDQEESNKEEEHDGTIDSIV